MSVEILRGDALAVLKTLPSNSVHCVVTSPPYWGLRDYGTGSWECGDDPACDHVSHEIRTGLGMAALGEKYRGGGHKAGDAEGKAIQFRDVCGKCGARRIDQQIGLEETPELWCARLVEVFREVRRVLRPDGVCFVNIGDSYAANGLKQTGRNDGGRPEKTGGFRNGRWCEGDWTQTMYDIPRTRGGQTPGLKPKDLIGAPWMLAKALRDPYYTGRIKREADRIWLAAIIDAEGCLFIHRRKAGQHNGQGYHRKADSFGPGLEVSNTNRAIVERCMGITGLGSICSQSNAQNEKRKQTIYRWNLRTVECRDIIREVYPHLVAKQQQARLLCGCPSSGENAAKAHVSLINLHRGRDALIDFPAPAPMFEPGWYLRADIVWNKPNPMPESVTDRPTKAHEQVFLLTKSSRYFYDAEAVREAHITELHAPGNRNVVQIKGNRDPGLDPDRIWGNPAGRNLRSVWTIATDPLPSIEVDGEKLDHFASYPVELARRCILAGTSAKGCCPQCGAQWARVVEREEGDHEAHLRPKLTRGMKDQTSTLSLSGHHGQGWLGRGSKVSTTSWRPTCSCSPADPVPARVLDPFFGSGRTGLACEELGRDCIGIELSVKSCAMAAAQLERAKARRMIGDVTDRAPVHDGQLRLF